MSTSATGEGTPTGSNPAGVASPNPDHDSSSPARTELRSVSTDGDRPATRRPAIGDQVEVECRGDWLPGTIDAVESDHFTVKGCGIPWGFDLRKEGIEWRWPLEQAAADPGNPVLEAADQFNAHPHQHCSVEDCTLWPLCSHPTANLQDALPEVRRCTAPITVGSDAGDVEDECGAVLGKDLHCQVCGGGLCYQHCAGVDHFGGRLVTSGSSGMLLWKIVEVASKRFRGQLCECLVGGRLKIVATVVGTTVDSVQEQLEWRIGQMVHASEQAAAARGEERPGREILFEALEFAAKVPPGKITDQRRAELLLEVIEWLRGCEVQWESHRSDYNHDRESKHAKELHDRQVVELFSRLAGAL